MPGIQDVFIDVEKALGHNRPQLRAALNLIYSHFTEERVTVGYLFPDDPDKQVHWVGAIGTQGFDVPSKAEIVTEETEWVELDDWRLEPSLRRLLGNDCYDAIGVATGGFFEGGYRRAAIAERVAAFVQWQRMGFVRELSRRLQFGAGEKK